MTLTDSKPGKAALLASLAVIMIGSASAALTWENPEEDYVASGTLTLEVTNDSETGTYMEFWYQKNDGDWVNADNDTSNDDDTWTGDLGLDQFADGDTLDLKANSTNDTNTKTVDVDQADPGSFSLGGNGYTSSDSPSVEVEATDDVSGIKNISIDVDDSDGNDVNSKDCTSLSDNTETCTIDLSGLDDDDYDVSVTAYDNVNRSTSNTLSFTVDTTKDFTVDPSFDPSAGVVDYSDDMDLDVTIDENNEDADVTLSCLDSDGDTIDSDTGDGTDFTCEIDDDYEDTTVDLSVEVCDKADNCEESDSSEFTFDASDPIISDSSLMSDVVNGDFIIDFSASDASGLDQIEYFYNDDSVSEGEGTSVSVSESTEEFTAGVGDISAGDHTIYFRVKDNAGRWSSLESIDFEYDPDAQPSVALNVPANLSVEAGSSKSFDVTLENTGKIFINELTLKADSSVFTNSITVTDLETGSKVTKTFTANTNKGDLGSYDLKVSIDNPSTSKTFPLTVTATENQEKSINSTFNKYHDKYQSLDANITELENSGLSDSRKERLESNISDFKDSILAAKKEINDGEYYAADGELENIESEFSQAVSSFEAIKEEHKKAQQRQLLMILGAIILVAAGGGVGFLVYSDDYDIDMDRLTDSDMEFESLEDVTERVKSLFSRGNEADDFEWDGFKDN